MPKQAQEIADQMAGDCLVARTRYLNRCITAIYDNAYAEHGISANQVGILAALVSMGERTSGEVATFFNMDKSTLSRNIERMKRNGWIETRREGRSHLLKPAPRGKALLKKTYPIWLEAQTQARKLLGAGDADALRSIVNKLWKLN